MKTRLPQEMLERVSEILTDAADVQKNDFTAENMMLAAASLGLGSVWVHREREIFDNLKGKTLLKEWGYRSL